MRRTRIAAATVLAAVGLIAATATPASAAGSGVFRTTQTCIEQFGGGTYSESITNVGYPKFFDISALAKGCVPGTLRMTVERIG